MPSPLTMSEANRESFLADVHVGVLALAASDDTAPIASPVWYEYEPGGDVLMNIGRRSVKARLIEASGRATLCAQREGTTPAFVSVTGPIAIEPVDDDLRRRLAVRYLGGELAALYLADTTGEDGVTARLTPERWRTQDYAQLRH